MEDVLQASSLILIIFSCLFYSGINYDVTLKLFGYLCIIFNLLIFVAPFSTIKKVINSSDAAPIHLLFSLIGLLGSIFWFVYGFIIDEVPLIVPNSIGIVLNAIQIFLYAIYSRKDKLISGHFSNENSIISAFHYFDTDTELA